MHEPRLSRLEQIDASFHYLKGSDRAPRFSGMPADGEGAVPGQRASFRTRLAAFLIDNAFLTVVLVVLRTVQHGAPLHEQWALCYAYTVGCTAWGPGQTIGRAIIKTRIVRLDDGRALGLLRAIARDVVKVPAVGLVGIGVLSINRAREGQAWHDRAVGSVVVSAREWPWRPADTE